MTLAHRSVVGVLCIAALAFAGGCGGSESTSADGTDSSAFYQPPPINPDTESQLRQSRADFNKVSRVFVDAISGNVGFATVQAETRKYRAALDQLDAELRPLDFAGYERERNDILTAIGNEIALLDEVTTATKRSEVVALAPQIQSNGEYFDSAFKSMFLAIEVGAQSSQSP